MEFKIGDKVRIKKDLYKIEGFSCGYMSEMGKYEGEVVTIESVTPNFVTIAEHRFNWDKRAFEPIYSKVTKEELIGMPIGTKITTDENEVLIKDDVKVFENINHVLSISEINENLTIDGRILRTKIVKVETPIYTTVYEEKKVKEMTLKEIEEQLGYKIRIKGE